VPKILKKEKRKRKKEKRKKEKKKKKEKNKQIEPTFLSICFVHFVIHDS
jgi:hypothetical protein